jgi:hypothetical protein
MRERDHVHKTLSHSLIGGPKEFIEDAGSSEDFNVLPFGRLGEF